MAWFNTPSRRRRSRDDSALFGIRRELQAVQLEHTQKLPGLGLDDTGLQ